MADTTTASAGTQAERNDALKKQLADQTAALQEGRQKLAEQMAGVKPTPTQDENDQAALGIHVVEHEPDGSPEQPPGGTPKPQATTTRQLEAQKPAPAPSTSKTSYSTKSAE